MHESELVDGSRISEHQVIELADSIIVMGLDGADIVACVHVKKDGSSSYIGMLAVNPLLQSAGVGKHILAYAEDYARVAFGAQKFMMVVLSARTELIAFYFRRGYQRVGSVMDYPVSAGVGLPKVSNLTIEVLEKIAH